MVIFIDYYIHKPEDGLDILGRGKKAQGFKQLCHLFGLILERKMIDNEHYVLMGKILREWR